MNVATISDKWARTAGQAGPDYKAGVETNSRSWLTATVGAADVHGKSTLAAAARGAYQKGVLKRNDAYWKLSIQLKGLVRWAQGVGISNAKYQAAFSIYRDALAALQMPPRSARGDPRNLQRVQAIIQTLRQLKESGRYIK